MISDIRLQVIWSNIAVRKEIIKIVSVHLFSNIIERATGHTCLLNKWNARQNTHMPSQLRNANKLLGS